MGDADVTSKRELMQLGREAIAARDRALRQLEAHQRLLAMVVRKYGGRFEVDGVTVHRAWLDRHDQAAVVGEGQAGTLHVTEEADGALAVEWRP
jgi:hypothetical protein